MDNKDIDKLKGGNSNVIWKESVVTTKDAISKSHVDKKDRKTWKWVALILILIFGGLYFGKLTGYSVSTDTVATINGVAISNAEIDKEYELFFLISGYPEQFRGIITKDLFLNQSIIQRLLIISAIDSGFSVKDEEVDKVVHDVIIGNQMTSTEFESKIAEQKFSMSEVKKYIKDQLLVNDFIKKQIEDAIDVKDSEILDHYNKNIENFNLPEQVRAAHILVCSTENTGCTNGLTKQEAITRINEVKTKIKNGGNFSELASEYSVDGSKEDGGDLGFFVRSKDNDGSMPSMVKEFEDSAFSLKIDEISDIVETMFGFHIIKALDHRDKGLRTIEQVKDEIKNIILEEKRKEELNSIIQELLSNNEIKVN